VLDAFFDTPRRGGK